MNILIVTIFSKIYYYQHKHYNSCFKLFCIITVFLSAQNVLADEEGVSGFIPVELRYEKIDYTRSPQFVLVAPNQDMAIGGLLQLDGRFFPGADQNNSTFLVRRARVFFTGKLYNTFTYMLIPRWDNMNADIYQAWVGLLCPEWAMLQVGLFKEPFSLEALTHDAYLTFAERSLAILNYLQILDIGVMLHANLFDDQIEYGFGIFNGRGEQFDNNNNKEFIGRIAIAIPGCEFRKAYVGLSGSTAIMDETLSGTSFKTGAQTNFFTWTENPKTPVLQDDTRSRWGADIEWYKGPFWFSAEYLYTNWGHVTMGDIKKRFRGHGGYIEASYLLTGEDKPRNAPIIPFHNFNCCDQWGAFELAARYETFYASKSVISAGMATGANRVHSPTLAFNWYFNPFVFVRLDGQYLKFNRRIEVRSHATHHESVITCRLQSRF